MKAKNSFSPEEGSAMIGKGIGWKKGILLMVVVVILIGALYLGFTVVTAKSIMQSTQLNGYFIDVNGDGKLDYVVSSEVILNTGQLNLTPSP